MTTLRRSVSLPLLVAYGLGTTIGAGIYILLGSTAARAGVYAPFSFVLAGGVVAFSAFAFAEMSARYPVAAGPAAYVDEGLRSRFFGLATGVLIILSGVVSSATLTDGVTGYIQTFISVDEPILIVSIVAVVAAICIWGVAESVTIAAIFTVIEVGALVVLICIGAMRDPNLVFAMTRHIPPISDAAAWTGAASGALLAFFAFIGFEDITALGEEVKKPRRNMPIAIVLTLVITLALYVLVASVAIGSVSVEALSASASPLGLVYQSITGAPPIAINLIAIAAAFNGVVIQIIMGSRVLYGLSARGAAPKIFGRVHAKTQTPVAAICALSLIVLVLALSFPLVALAEWTSRIILVVFALVNLALIALKMRGKPAPEGAFTIPIGVPVAGVAACLAMLIGDIWL